MRRRWIPFGLALVAVVAGIIVVLSRGPTEPVYEGKKLSYWFNREKPRPQDPGDNGQSATKAVKALGTNAVPWLLSEFSRRDSQWRVVLQRWLQDAGTEDERIQSMAKGLYRLGPALAPALPELFRFLGDGRRGGAAALAMSGAGPPALPYFLRGTDSTNVTATLDAAYGLGLLVGQTEAAIPPVVQMLQHSNAALRRIAADRLYAVRALTDPVVPALTQALSDPDHEVRKNAAHTLGKLGDKAKVAVPALVRLMQDTNVEVAASASNAVYRLAPSALPKAGRP